MNPGYVNFLRGDSDAATLVAMGTCHFTLSRSFLMRLLRFSPCPAPLLGDSVYSDLWMLSTDFHQKLSPLKEGPKFF